MGQIDNSVKVEVYAGGDDGALEMRIFRAMMLSAAIAVIVSAFLAPWSITTGLMLGGALSLLNYHWLRTSVAAIFQVGPTERPRVKVSRYILRYLVVGVTAFAAYKLRLVSLGAVFAGLCAFVPALFVEALRQFYFSIVHREESF